MTLSPTTPLATPAPGRSVGSDRARVEAPLKVTGTAPYGYEQPVERPAFVFPVLAGIARGRIAAIDSVAAERVPGVLLVLTHHNAPKLRVRVLPQLHLLQSDEVRFRNEVVGGVVAETPEAARHAASLVQVEYAEQPARLSFDPDDPAAYDVRRVSAIIPGSETHGDVEAGLAEAATRVEAEYRTPEEYHNPLEPHPATAQWHERSRLDPRGTRLSLFDANQGPTASLLILAPIFGLLPNQIEVTAPYVGGSFGTKTTPHAHHILAIMAAKLLPGRAVKASLTRQQMFHFTGYRPATVQRLRLGADADARLTAVEHVAVTPVSRVLKYVDANVSVSRVMYSTATRHTRTRGVLLDTAPGSFMRAPGEFTGMFALETAVDELAHAAGVDPIELRIRNEPELDPESGHPWSLRLLVDCLRTGAEVFGWDRRTPPGQQRDGEWQLGVGVACSTFPNMPVPPMWARITFEGGRYRVQIQASDLGTGAWTILPQIAADALGVSVDLVDGDIGRTGVPAAMMAGGSTGTYTWGASVIAAAQKFRSLHGDHPPEGATARARGHFSIAATRRSRHSFGAQFAEVAVSAVTGEVRVRRLYGHFDVGRVINPRLVRSQLIGGMTMGLSGALHEEAYRDPRHGHVANCDFAGYHIAAHADVTEVEAGWLGVPDPWAGPTGAKSVGEVGNVGVPAAIGNAVFNATGRRLRELPFTPDKLFD